MTSTTTLIVNGETEDHPASATLLDLVSGHIDRELAADGTPTDGGRLGVAAAIDGAVVPRGRWSATTPTSGANIDIVTAAQGG